MPASARFAHSAFSDEPQHVVAVLPNTGKSECPLVTKEIFRYWQKRDRDEADAFVALLLASAAQNEVHIYVVITMRSDFLGECAVFHGLPESMNDSQYLTPRLTREQCRLAIAGPARVFGGSVEAPLVNRLLNDFGPDPDQLPLLQHALMRMWERAQARAREAGEAPLVALRDYEELGGLTRALSDHADEALHALSPRSRPSPNSCSAASPSAAWASAIPARRHCWPTWPPWLA